MRENQALSLFFIMQKMKEKVYAPSDARYELIAAVGSEEWNNCWGKNGAIAIPR